MRQRQKELKAELLFALYVAQPWPRMLRGLGRDLRHVRSQRVMEKLGMHRVGIRAADHLGRDGVLVDEVRYELSRSEWLAAKG